MKIFTILADLFLLIFFIGAYVIDNGFDDGFGANLLFIFIMVVIVLNVYLILRGKTDDGWVSLFLKRKALEEKEKIARIQQSK